MPKLKIRWQRLVDEAQRTCPRCGGTEKEIEQACLKLKEALKPLNIEVVFIKEELRMEDFKKAPLESNKIWIAGRDIEEWLGAKTGQSPCCDLCGDSECRTVEIADNVYETIPSSLIIKAGLIAAAEFLPVITPFNTTVTTIRREKT
jgi:hypothetical protein